MDAIYLYLTFTAGCVFALAVVYIGYRLNERRSGGE